MKAVEVNKMDNENNIFEQYAELVKRWKAGDVDAFTEIYEKSQRLVYTTCLGILNNEQDAEEATQDTYLKVYENIASLTDEKLFIPWLKRIAASRALDKCRARKDESSYEDAVSADENLEYDDNLDNLPEALVIEKDKRDTFHKIIRDSLSDDQYRTTLLFYYDDMPVADIARLMNCPENTIKTKLRLSRAKIKAGVKAFESANKISLMGGAAGTGSLGRFFSEFYGSAKIPALKALPLEVAGSKGAAAGTKVAAKAAGKAASAGAKGSFLSSPLAKIGIGVAAIAVLAVPAVFAIKNLTDESGNTTKRSKKGPVEIDLNDYIEYEFSGYDGKGIVTYNVDLDQLISDNDKLKNCNEDDLADGINGSWDRDSDLSNGDVIVFDWSVHLKDIENKYKVEFLDDDLEVTVRGLEKMPEIDPFDYIEIEYNGVAPYTYVVIRTQTTPIGDILYSSDASFYVKNGDTFTITASSYYTGKDLKQQAEEAGYTLTRDTMEVTVEGVDEYVNTMNDISAECIEFMEEQAISLYYENNRQLQSDEHIDSLAMDGMYFLTIKDSSSWLGPGYNYCYIVLKANISSSAGSVEQYFYVRFQDLIKHSDNSVTLDTSWYMCPIGDKAMYGILVGDAFEIDDDHWYIGFKDLDTLYSYYIYYQLDTYNCESTY